jgi:hypothetical protein
VINAVQKWKKWRKTVKNGEFLRIFDFRTFQSIACLGRSPPLLSRLSPLNWGIYGHHRGLDF